MIWQIATAVGGFGLGILAGQIRGYVLGWRDGRSAGLTEREFAELARLN